MPPIGTLTLRGVNDLDTLRYYLVTVRPGPKLCELPKPSTGRSALSPLHP